MEDVHWPIEESWIEMEAADWTFEESWIEMEAADWLIALAFQVSPMLT